MPQLFITSTLPTSNPKLTKKPESTGYNWKTLIKAGLVFVATTSMFLTLKATKSFSLISSWLENKRTDFDEQETKLTVREGIEAYSGYQRTGLWLTDFEPSKALQTDNSLQLTDFKESPLAAFKDSYESVTFMPQRAKRNPMGMLEKIGPEFLVNTYTMFYQVRSSITVLSDGKFVVTWDSDGQDGDSYGVSGQMFNADGNKFFSEFQVNTYTTDEQSDPAVAGLSDGKFVVTWDSDGQDGSGKGIYGQMYNADGNKYSSEFQVNTYTVNTQCSSSIAGLNDGKFVVTWHGWTDGNDYGIYGQMFNADGSKYSSEFQVNTYTVNTQCSSSIAGLNDGKFVVTWHGWTDGNDYGIYGQMFNADGNKFFSEFQVNTYTIDEQAFPSVAGLSDGKFVVTWSSYGQDGDSGGVYGQMFNTDGTKFLSEFQVNTYTTSTQTSSSVAGLTNGKFVVTWTGDQDGHSFDIYGQMFREYDSFVSSSSQQIPESSSEVSNYSPTVSSLETSSSIITSDTETSSYSSEQSTSSTKKSSSLGMSSFSTSSIETSRSYSSISSMLETSNSIEPISSIRSDEPIYSDSIHVAGLSSGAIIGIVFGTIATVGLCVAGGFFAAKRICKSDRDQSIEDIELDLTIPKTFRCSLTGKMMNEPVEIAGERDRFYDREEIEEYFAREHKSPSGKSLKKLVLIPNYDLRSKIDEYKETLEQPTAPQLEVD